MLIGVAHYLQALHSFAKYSSASKASKQTFALTELCQLCVQLPWCSHFGDRENGEAGVQVVCGRGAKESFSSGFDCL